MVIETHSFKIFPFFLGGYHTPQLQNIATPAMAFSPYNLKVLQPYFCFGDRKNVSNIIAIVSNITMLVSHNVIFFRYFIPMSHGLNQKTAPSASLHLPPCC